MFALFFHLPIPIFNMPKAKKAPPVRSFSAFVLNKHKYFIKDPILVFSGMGKEPFIAEIVKIEALQDDHLNVMLTVKWFYRPEEIHGGRRDYHGKDELLRSDHTDRIHVDSVNGPCRVVSLEEYRKLTLQSGDDKKEEEEEETVFYTREFYDYEAKEIISPLEKLCVCQTPENPDLQMIQCDACESWYHVKCTQVSDEEMEKKYFICQKCRASGIKLA